MVSCTHGALASSGKQVALRDVLEPLQLAQRAIEPVVNTKGRLAYLEAAKREPRARRSALARYCFPRKVMA